MKKLFLTIVVALVGSSAFAQTKDYTRWVNPFIGTGGHGHTFPGATMPFGMVQLSPDTRTDNWDGSSGYHYSDDIIYGFSHTHLSGTGIPDGCDILFMPTIGEPQFFAKEGDTSINGYASKFSHANEKAEPGYYSVKLDDDSIVAEMTATPRVGFHRYTFPKSNKANIILDLKWRDKVLDSELNIFEKTTSDDSLYVRGNKETKVTKFTSVTGYRVEGYRRSSFWAKDQIVYFSAEFSKPFENYNIDNDVDEIEIRTDVDYKGKDLKAAFHFKTAANEKILLKVALSFVSIEGARKNLKTELPHWDFDKVRADAKAAWNKELSKIEVSGGTLEQTTNFYTALYHTMIQPNVFNDVDGSYKGHDGKIHQLPGYAAVPPYLRRSYASPRGAIKVPGGSAAVSDGRQSRKPVISQRRKSGAFPQIDGQSPPEQYTVFSLWDTFRAAHPLYTIIDQKRTVDFINTFIRQYEQGGRLPVWELWGEETDTMIGYHAVSVIADAMAKGIKGFDYEKAYAASKHSAELNHFGLAAYKKRGYISMEDENESVSKTLEYAYNDWCISRMARVLFLRESKQPKSAPKARFDKSTGIASFPIDMEKQRYQQDLANYLKRARYFENLFDTKIGFFRAKKNGSFVEPFAPTEVNFGFTEGNSWQYSFFVPHDVEKLTELMGGRQKFVAKLDELFTSNDKLSGREQADLTGLIGQYAHGNEPSHHIAYLYNYAQEPWKTQKYVRRIMDEFYKPTPDGLIGNEDCGQMSAWYIMSAGGFYPVAPGSPVYAFGTPLFPEITYKLENGKAFTIRAKNVSPRNIYILNAKLNGSPYKQAFITHADLMRGGVLEFAMIDQTVTTAFTEYPTSTLSVETSSVPTVRFGNLTDEGIEVFFESINPMDVIFYTTDGTDPFNSKTAIVNMGVPHLKDSTNLKVVSYDPDRKVTSKIVEAVYRKKPNDWTVKVISGYSTQYTGGGDNAIIDGIRGTVNFASGEWQGVQGKPYEAVIDLRRETEIREVGGSFLQVAGPWIWMPDRIEFETSNDGVNFTCVAEIRPGFPQKEMAPTVKEFTQKISPTKARYVRIRAYNFGKIPNWHPGAGGDPWIFVDEVIIR